jgi:thymidylate kinase
VDSEKLIIFEGPDGGGKTTTIKKLVTGINTHVVHHGPYKNVSGGLARLYVESMLPAVLGFTTTVLDRSWLSEPIYGKVFRGGENRLGVTYRRHLERLALRCDPTVVLCLPPLEVVLRTYRERRQLELLDNEKQLTEVYELYNRLESQTDLEVLRFDYTKDAVIDLVRRGTLSGVTLSTSHHGAGNLLARIVLVGDEFGERQDGDTLYQWPFAALTRLGCSTWLTDQLVEADIPESELLWVNSDELEAFNEDLVIDNDDRLHYPHVFALGQKAHERLTALDIHHVTVDHPQHAKRFHHHEPYPLIGLIQQARMKENA